MTLQSWTEPTTDSSPRGPRWRHRFADEHYQDEQPLNSRAPLIVALAASFFVYELRFGGVIFGIG